MGGFFKNRAVISAILIFIVAGGLIFYFGPGVFASEQAQGGQGGQPQAMPVQVSIISSEPVQIWNSFSGRIVAVDKAEIRPQVSGRITEIKFEDGQHVEAGDVLMIIDPRPYKAAVNEAQAALATARTEASLAEKEYQRAKSLIQTEAISQSLLDRRLNNRQSASAAVKRAQAQLEQAEINLDYAYVKAPISGKVSRAEITEGNLVQSGSSSPVLTSIVADDRVYADFEVDENTYIAAIKAHGAGHDQDIPVRLKIPGRDKEFKGTIQSFDNQIDPSTGTIRARAVFDNEEKMLLPGMTVTVLMGGASENNQIVLTERAIGTDQDRKFVYLVNDDKMIEYREVKIGDSVNGKRVILDGLSEGEMVVAEGIVKIRPGMPVMPKVNADTAAGEPENKEQMQNEDNPDMPPSDQSNPAEEK